MVRVERAAKRAGKTSCDFILDAIAEKVEWEEKASSFDAEADARFAKIIESGKTIPWSEMRQYVQDRAAGKQTPRPIAMKPV